MIERRPDAIHFTRQSNIAAVVRAATQQDMEVIGHDAVRQHSAARKILLHPHEHPELLPLVISEHKPPTHHTGTPLVLAPINETASGGGAADRMDGTE